MRNLYYKEIILQTTWGMIFSLLFLISPVFADDQFTPKDLLDIQTDAWALYNTAQGKRALEVLEKIPQQYRNAEIYTVMANIYEDLGDTNKALETLNKAIKVDPKFYKAYYNFGVIHLKRKSWALAESNFKLAIKYNSKFPYSYYNLGICYLENKDYINAKKNFIKALSLKGDEKDFYQSLAYTYKMLGREKEAKKVLDAYNKL